jgi:hypothetical protein
MRMVSAILLRSLNQQCTFLIGEPVICEGIEVFDMHRPFRSGEESVGDTVSQLIK